MRWAVQTRPPDSLGAGQHQRTMRCRHLTPCRVRPRPRRLGRTWWAGSMLLNPLTRSLRGPTWAAGDPFPGEWPASAWRTTARRLEDRPHRPPRTRMGSPASSARGIGCARRTGRSAVVFSRPPGTRRPPHHPPRTGTDRLVSPTARHPTTMVRDRRRSCTSGRGHRLPGPGHLQKVRAELATSDQDSSDRDLAASRSMPDDERGRWLLCGPRGTPFPVDDAEPPSSRRWARLGSATVREALAGDHGRCRPEPPADAPHRRDATDGLHAWWEHVVEGSAGTETRKTGTPIPGQPLGLQRWSQLVLCSREPMLVCCCTSIVQQAWCAGSACH